MNKSSAVKKRDGSLNIISLGVAKMFRPSEMTKAL